MGDVTIIVFRRDPFDFVPAVLATSCSTKPIAGTLMNVSRKMEAVTRNVSMFQDPIPVLARRDTDWKRIREHAKVLQLYAIPSYSKSKLSFSFVMYVCL